MVAIGSLTGNTPIPTTPTYTTAAEVARILQKPVPSEHSDEGEPTLTQWNQTILAKEGEVDHWTKTSWRLRRELLEYHDFQTFIDEESWLLVKLRNAPTRTLDAASGDGLEVRQGGTWEDWLATKTQGPSGQFWIQEPEGFLRLRRSLFQYTDQARVRISYRYGISAVPAEIGYATALLAAAELSTGDLISLGGRNGEVDRVGVDPRVRRWERTAYAILAGYQKWGGS